MKIRLSWLKGECDHKNEMNHNLFVAIKKLKDFFSDKCGRIVFFLLRVFGTHPHLIL